MDKRSSALDRALAAWGDDMPDWVHILADACDSSSQKKVAAELDYSPAVVNQVLGNKYKGGDLGAVQQAVEGALMAHSVDCPVLGELRANFCLENQKRSFSPTNSTRVRLFKACHGGGCPHSRIGRNA